MSPFLSTAPNTLLQKCLCPCVLEQMDSGFDLLDTRLLSEEGGNSLEL